MLPYMQGEEPGDGATCVPLTCSTDDHQSIRYLHGDEEAGDRSVSCASQRSIQAL